MHGEGSESGDRPSAGEEILFLVFTHSYPAACQVNLNAIDHIDEAF
jgi:hypothetical protein